MKKLIHLDQLDTYVQVGIHDFEKAAPQRYLVSIWLTLPSAYRCNHDAIEETVNYDALRARVLSHLASDAFNLQERIAQDILDICFELDARVLGARVTVTKPTVYPDCAGVGLDYSCSREEWAADLEARTLPR